MKKQWFQNGKRIITGSKRILCDQCPCGLWVAGGSGTSNYNIFTSRNGINWAQVQTPFSGVTAIAFNGSIWVAGGGTKLGYSLDGTNWTTTPNIIDTVGTICWNGSIWVAGGYSTDGTSNIRYMTSPDGINWTGRSSNMGGVNAIAWNGSMFVAVGYDFQRAVIETSTDGINWVESSIPYIAEIRNVAWNGFLWVAVGWALGWTGITTSPDGINWTERSNPLVFPDILYTICWSGSIWVAGGSKYMTSSDGINWTERTRPFPYGEVQDIAWNGSMFVAVDYAQEIAYSADGINWTLNSLGGYRKCVASNPAPNLYPTIGV